MDNTKPDDKQSIIEKLFHECWSTETPKAELPNSTIRTFKLREALQIVYKENKGWIFHYKESVLYTLTQVAALFIYAVQEGFSYEEIVSKISNHYKIPVYSVDADFQEFLADLYKLKLIRLT